MMPTKFAAVALGSLMALVSPAEAGFQRWTATVTSNPFSDGTNVSVLYNMNRRAQVQVRCDSGEQGIELVMIPGYEMSFGASAFRPTVRIAVDGEIILEGIRGEVSAYGANQAGVSITLQRADADVLTDAFVKALRQIAIEDGMSQEPLLLTARGSTAAARKVQQCYQAQKGGDEPLTDEQVAGTSSSERAREIQAEIDRLQAELRQLASN